MHSSAGIASPNNCTFYTTNGNTAYCFQPHTGTGTRARSGSSADSSASVSPSTHV
jgi:hypothetical protein